MSIPKFEVGKKYKSKGAWIAEVTAQMGSGFIALHHMPDGHSDYLLHRRNGVANYDNFDSVFDLMLPAIEKEAAHE